MKPTATEMIEAVRAKDRQNRGSGQSIKALLALAKAADEGIAEQKQPTPARPNRQTVGAGADVDLG